jgi:hypothetical protein
MRSRRCFSMVLWLTVILETDSAQDERSGRRGVGKTICYRPNVCVVRMKTRIALPSNSETHLTFADMQLLLLLHGTSSRKGRVPV